MANRKNSTKKGAKRKSKLANNKPFDPDASYLINSIKGSRGRAFWLIVGISGLLLALVLLAYISYYNFDFALFNRFKSDKRVEKKNKVIDADPNSDVSQEKIKEFNERLAKAEKSITFDSPLEDEEVTGSFFVQGEATASIEKIKVELKDSEANPLGSTVLVLSGGYEHVQYGWFGTVDVIKSPASQSGFIYAYPESEGIDSTLTVRKSIKFNLSEVEDRLRVLSPLENQVVTGKSFVISGEMKNFFEGVMKVRLLDSTGEVVEDVVVNASGDNYEDFSPFSVEISLEDVPLDKGSVGSFEFYENSAKDGDEEVLLTIPVRFQAI